MIFFIKPSGGESKNTGNFIFWGIIGIVTLLVGTATILFVHNFEPNYFRALGMIGMGIIFYSLYKLYKWAES